MAITDWPKPLSETAQTQCAIAPEHYCCINSEDELCMLWRVGKMKVEGAEVDVGWCGPGGKPEDKYFVGAFLYP